VLGLAITLGVGGLLIILASTIELLAECVSKCSRRGTYRRLEWSANGMLQLQRLAHEELGYGGAWMSTAAFVPVTRPASEPLAILDVHDVHHPRLQRSAALTPPSAPGAQSSTWEGSTNTLGTEASKDNSNA
jgi:hypothetical protein